MCSYMAMFPPTMPRVFIDWLTEPGDVVYDPFSGRGTTVLEACNSGRIGLGSDANPLAWLLTAAKTRPPAQDAIERRLFELRNGLQRLDPSAEPPEIQAVFDPDVLGQLLWLRSELSLKSVVDRYLYATLLGILHANARSDGTPRGLTISMPNTFAMAPRYVMRFKETHRLVPPKVDVLDAIEARVYHLGSVPAHSMRGHAWLQDAMKPIRIPGRFDAPRLIFTSPPYLGVMRYGKLNWLRLWLLGRTPPAVDARLFASSSLPRYLEFMCSTLERLAGIMSRNGRICLVIGDVRKDDKDLNLAQAVADHCPQRLGLRVDAIIQDELPVQHKVSRIWREKKGRATKTDRILILSRRRAPRLPPVPVINWSQ